MMQNNYTENTLLSEKNAMDSLSSVIEIYLKKYFKAHDGGIPPIGLYDRIIKEVEKPLITEVLKLTGGNQVQAAKILDINRNTLRKKITLLGIETDK